MNDTENDYLPTDLGNVSLNPRGEYDLETAYEYLDTVSYQGGSYVCRVENGTTITGTAPKPGKNTEFWQLLTLPGNLTAEAVAMHDDVVNKAAQVENSRAAVEQAQQEVEASQADVQQLHEDTVQAAQEAENSRDSAAGYAQSAEQSRKAASESEQNINAQMTGLNQKVSELVTQATGDIAAVRQQAIDTITTQEDTSTEAVKQVGNASLESARQALRDINTAGQRAVQTVTDQKNASVQAVKDEAKDYIENKKKEIDDKTDEVTQAVNQAGKKQLEDIANSLDSTLTESGKAADSKTVGDALNTKITKFYASNQGETHIVDSDNGKIMDMIIYGRSEQETTTGAQLFIPRNETFESCGVTVTYDDNGVITLNGTVTANIGTIGFLDIQADMNFVGNLEKMSVSDAEYWIYINADSYKTVYASNVNKYFTTDSGIEPKRAEVRIGANAGEVFNNVKFRLTIAKGTEKKAWEPYTGGVPSPNPDYPQEIKAVENPEVKIYGKNLLNYASFPDSVTLSGVTIKNNNDGSFTVSGVKEKQGGVNLQGKKCVIPKGTYVASGFLNELYIVISFIKNGVIQYLQKTSKPFTFDEDTEITPYIQANDDYKNETVTIYPQIERGSTNTSYEPYKKEQTATLPYVLNAIPVDSDGNYTDADGQQWICDEIDFARGKYVQRLEAITIDSSKLVTYTSSWITQYEDSFVLIGTQIHSNCIEGIAISNIASKPSVNIYIQNIEGIDVADADRSVRFRVKASSAEEAKEKVNGKIVIVALKTPIETDLRDEEIAAYKALTTYYPVTNISVNSDQLDGYTVFNYPVSMANGWNYVKQQLSDNRDYIYDMDAKTQDIDTQSTEAYVNSEYAVALTELEAM